MNIALLLIRRLVALRATHLADLVIDLADLVVDLAELAELVSGDLVLSAGRVVVRHNVASAHQSAMDVVHAPCLGLGLGLGPGLGLGLG